MTRRQYMFRWNLGLTTRLAYALSTITILFLSSAFISLANASIADPPGPVTIDPPAGVSGSDAEELRGMDADPRRIKARLENNRDNQESYINRWQERKNKYRLYEEYAAWLRDHQDPGGGNFGPQGIPGEPGFTPITLGLPTFVSMILNSF